MAKTTNTATRYQKRRKTQMLKLALKIAAGAAGLVALFVLYLALFTDVFHPLSQLHEVNVPASAEVAATQEDIYYQSGPTHNKIDVQGNPTWNYKFTGENLTVACSETLVCVYNESFANILDPDKNVRFTVPASDFTITDVRCGQALLALLCTLEGDTQNMYIRVFDEAGAEIYRETYANLTVQDFGLYGQTDNLWALTLDSSGVEPISRITTSSPSQNALTGTIEITDQLISDVFYIDAQLFVSGTTSLSSYDTFGNRQNSTLVYGLKCIDLASDGNNYTLVYTTRAASDPGSAYSIRCLASTDDGPRDTFIQLPSNTIAVHTSISHIYCFLEDSVYVYQLTGEFAEEIPLDFTLTKTQKLSSNQVLLFAKGGSSYYMSIN